MGEMIVMEEYLPSIDVLNEVVMENIGRALELSDLEKWVIDKGTFTSNFDASAEEIECIIIAKRYERRYYENSESLDTPPDCYSYDLISGHGNPGIHCSECPNNVFVSNKGKDCKDRAEVIFLKKGDMIPSRINLPTMSVSILKKYLLSLTAKGKLFKNVVTKMSLTKEKNASGKSYSKLKLEAIGELAGHHEILKQLKVSDI